MTLPAQAGGTPAIAHGSIVKIMIVKDGNIYDKLSPWARYVTAPTDGTNVYHQVRDGLQIPTRILQVFYNPPHPYKFEHARSLKRPRAMRIYEAHVGIASDEGHVSTYRHFADKVIPRIARQGYNAIQLMAIMEHAYYASFGYQVTSFFAASRWAFVLGASNVLSQSLRHAR